MLADNPVLPDGDPRAEEAKTRVYEAFARVGGDLSHPLRLRVLELLAQGERTVDEVERHTPLRRKNASAQLRVLLRDGLVARRKDGIHTYYRIADDGVIRLLRELQRLSVVVSPEAASLDREFFGSGNGDSVVELAELPDLLASGAAWLLDVRPSQEYRQGHIPGAHSIPIFELGARLEEVPDEPEIIVYCRGPFCVWEVEAAHFLREHGRRARRLAATVVDWRLRSGS